MDHVLGLQSERDRAAGGNVQLPGCDVSIGVMEQKGELHRCHLDRQGIDNAGIDGPRTDPSPNPFLCHPRLGHRGGVVMGEGNHAAHPVVDVVAVKADEQNNNGGNGCPENFQRKIAFDGDAIAELPRSTSETHQAEHQQSDDADEKNGPNREQNLKKFVVDRSIHAGINRQKIDVLANPHPAKDKDHADDKSDDC